MKGAKVAAAIVACVTFLGSVVLSRDWLVTGGGDWPSFLFWTALCLSAGFTASSLLLDASFERRVNEAIDAKTATDDEVRRALGQGA